MAKAKLPEFQLPAVTCPDGGNLIETAMTLEGIMIFLFNVTEDGRFFTDKPSMDCHNVRLPVREEKVTNGEPKIYKLLFKI